MTEEEHRSEVQNIKLVHKRELEKLAGLKLGHDLLEFEKSVDDLLLLNDFILADRRNLRISDDTEKVSKVITKLLRKIRIIMSPKDSNEESTRAVLIDDIYFENEK